MEKPRLEIEEEMEEGKLIPLNLRTDELKKCSFQEEVAFWRSKFQKEAQERTKKEEERIEAI